jgi:hypothetical protein
VVKLVVSVFRLSGLLPKLVGTAHDFDFGWFVHFAFT